MTNEAALKKIRTDYDTAIEGAERKRAVSIAQAADAGVAQKDLIAATGYTRETIRQLTMKGRKMIDGGEA